MTLLLTLLLKSLLVFAFAGAALFALRRSSAAARHLACLLTLFALLALPLFSLTLPGWHLPVLAHSEPTPAQAPTLPKGEGKEIGVGLTPAVGNAPAFPNSLSSPLGRTPAKSLVTKQGGGFLSLAVDFCALYVLGVLLACLRPLLGLWGIRRLSRLCTDVRDTPTLAVAARCAALLGLPTPRLCRADVCVPITWGWRRPVIALPSASTDWPEDRLRSVLLHEMAHVKRRDWPGHRFADLVCALYWFHPLVWLTARRLRVESELACDDLVLASGIPAPDYARHLLDIAQALPSASAIPQAAIGMAQTSRIAGRITMLLDQTRSRCTLTRRILLFAATVVTAALVPLAMLRPTAKAQAMSQSAQTSATNGPIQLAGIADATVPNGNEWGADGKALAAPVFSNHWGPGTKITAKPGQKALFFVFHLSKSLQHIPVLYDVSGTTQGGITMTQLGSAPGKKIGLVTETMQSIQMQSFDGTVVYGAAFPASLAQTNIRVGVDSGSWATALTVHYNFKRGYPVANVSGGQYAGAIDLSGDTFKYSLPTKTPNDFYDIRFIAVDRKGHEMLLPAIKTESKGGREQSTVRQPQKLSRIWEIRVEARPLVWTEFKNVALQPSGVSTASATGPDAATVRLGQIYGFIQTYRRTHGGAFPATNPPGLQADLASRPQIYGLPDLGDTGNMAQAAHFFTGPDNRLTVYLMKNKRPDGTLVGTAKRTGTRDVFAYTNWYVRNHPHGATGDYLVLWDDGTVSRIPADKALAVPAYDLIGPTEAGATQRAARQGVMQIAFPGQAGLPRS